MKRKISIYIIAFFLYISKQAVVLFNWLKISAKNFPEIVSVPIAILSLCFMPYIMQYSGINWLFQIGHDDPSNANRNLLAFEIMIIAIISLFLSNAASYGAIKFNRKDLWKYYTDRNNLSESRYTDKLAEETLFKYWLSYCILFFVAIFTLGVKIAIH
jgi:hypothetical protein